MQLDRFTQKAQEAIISAQETAQRLQSPILDAEHLLSALVEPDDGIPAETLRPLHRALRPAPLAGLAGAPRAEPPRRLGVALPAFRGELAAELAKRARVQ